MSLYCICIKVLKKTLKIRQISKFTGDWDELQRQFFTQTFEDKKYDTMSRNLIKIKL